MCTYVLIKGALCSFVEKMLMSRKRLLLAVFFCSWQNKLNKKTDLKGHQNVYNVLICLYKLRNMWQSLPHISEFVLLPHVVYIKILWVWIFCPKLQSAALITIFIMAHINLFWCHYLRNPSIKLKQIFDAIIQIMSEFSLENVLLIKVIT